MKCPKCNKPLSAYTDTFYSCDFCGWMGMATAEANKMRADASNISAKDGASIAIMALEETERYLVNRVMLWHNDSINPNARLEDKKYCEGGEVALTQHLDYVRTLIANLKECLK